MSSSRRCFQPGIALFQTTAALVEIVMCRFCGLSFLLVTVTIYVGATQIQSLPVPAASQTMNHDKPSVEDAWIPTTESPAVFLKNIGRDQEDIWTSPFKARERDLEWLLPLAGLTAGTMT